MPTTSHPQHPIKAKPEGGDPGLLGSLHELEQQFNAATSIDNVAAPKPIETQPAAVETPVIQPEQQPVAVEQQPSRVESAQEEYNQVDETKPDESPYVIKHANKIKPIQADEATKSQMLTDIEEIMTGDLGKVYQTMTPEKQIEFKRKGEEVAKAIEDLTLRVKVTARKVLALIREWLKLIPGVNKYFLEQEAKIKAEELLKYAHRRYTKQ